MSQAARRSQGLHRIRTAASLFRPGGWSPDHIEPHGLRYVATASVWVRWVLAAACFTLLVYRHPFGPERYAAFAALFLLYVAINGYTHYRLASNRTVTWRWILAHLAVDVAVISIAVMLGGGFSHYFFHLLYYPALAGYAVIFTSFRLNMAWVTMVAVIYLAISLAWGDGIDLGAREEKPLIVRIVVMYAVAASINLIASFERNRWRAAVRRERAAVQREGALQRERIDLSQAIHDTTAQSAYMIGLGIDAAKQVAGDANEELTARLEATSRLSKTAIWQLRHPIDMGRIFEGRELARTLDSHVATFTAVTSVPAELTQNGVEPPLSTEARSLLFSIAHNALTNAFRHAGAGRVLIGLDFGEDELRLSVSDDGVGLPGGYEERGHGFANMRACAERLGGRLVVEPRGPDGGASVTCVMQPALDGKEV